MEAVREETSPGRAGKYGELQGDSGGRYEGEVLAGRPHGSGRYLLPKNDGSGHMVVQYEGDWVQGQRQGSGTRYYVNGETYIGQFVSGAPGWKEEI
ncbi:uncharacterized protein HaLaN_10158 [Haematococcus lacustris]|uniref:MORN repeat-containing protein 3 n=1 Tax=Haematococcus lacustris TaxID=44745 RepID=A0A699Z519_HAELA|nr:uncharacterized protein HaLaN_10158 [Haematococcus lacustris]